MNSSRFTTTLSFIIFFLLQLLVSCSYTASSNKEAQTDSSGVAVLLVDTDHPLSTMDENIYCQFLEHINHSVE